MLVPPVINIKYIINTTVIEPRVRTVLPLACTVALRVQVNTILPTKTNKIESILDLFLRLTTKAAASKITEDKSKNVSLWTSVKSKKPIFCIGVNKSFIYFKINARDIIQRKVDSFSPDNRFVHLDN